MTKSITFLRSVRKLPLSLDLAEVTKVANPQKAVVCFSPFIECPSGGLKILTTSLQSMSSKHTQTHTQSVPHRATASQHHCLKRQEIVASARVVCVRVHTIIISYFLKQDMESAELLYSAITAQIFQEINSSGKITCSRRKPPGVEATGQLDCSLLCADNVNTTRHSPTGPNKPPRFLINACGGRQFLLSSGGNMTLTAVYFYQALYVPCSLAKPFLKLSRPGNKKNARRETGEET